MVTIMVDNVAWSKIFVLEKKIYSVNNFLITQYCVNKLATAILKKNLFVIFNSSGSREPFSTPLGCHQEPVTMPPGSPGASDNAPRVTRSQ